MFAKLVKLIPRRGRVAVAFCILAISYVPLLAFGNHAASVLPPLAVTAIIMTLAPRHPSWFIVGSVGLTGIAFAVSNLTLLNLTWAAESTAGWFTFGSLGLTQLVLGTAQAFVSRSRWGMEGIQRRLAGRVQRQSLELQAAQESAEKLTKRQLESNRRALLEHLPVHIVQKDLQGRFTFVTQSFCELVNRAYEEVIGCTDADLFPKEASQKFMEDDRRVMREGVVFDDVERNQLPDGTHSYMQVRKAPLRAADGSISGVQGIFWDVTEEHTGRQELQRTEALAHALIHATLDAVLIVDPNGCVMEANPAAETILGYTREQVALHPPVDAIIQTSLEEAGQRATDPKESVHYFDRKVPIARILETATGRRIEARLRRSNGVWFDAEVSAHPLSIEGTKGWAMFVRDITRRKRHETELRSAKELAERANAAKSEFVANVSHELRTPLTGIIGLHELLQRSEIDSRQQNYLQLAQISASNLLNLIDDLLDFSKIEAGRIDIESVPFSLIDCVEEAAASIAARAQLRGLELIVDLAPSLPVETLGDPHRIKQILLNLLGNAIKFTEKGDICIRVFSTRALKEIDAQKQVLVRFEVHDNGIGVPSEQREIIFDAFRQADSSTTRRYGGTGLGLTICRDLVAMMNGNIGITDADNPSDDASSPGSCFFFDLPLAILREADGHFEYTEDNREEVVLVARPSPWRTLLESQIRQLGFPLNILSGEELAARQPAHLFDAGNNTIVVGDYRELNALHLATTPVVVRWLMLTPLANSQPTSTPQWLKYADVRWLARPVRRRQLLEALIDQSPQAGKLEAVPATETFSAQVLLVEDSPVSQTVLKDMLESLGHQVQVAGNGREAIAACERELFDLVLMDIQMPEVDGLAATQAIRQHESDGKHQLILALTAHASTQDRELCRSAGMNGFLVKPIKLEALQQAIADSALGVAINEPSFAGPVIKGHDDANPDQQNNPNTTGKDMQNSESNTPDDVHPEHPLGNEVESLGDAPEWPALVTLMGGNENLLRDVLQLLVREIPKLARMYSEALAKRDFKEARRAVHTMKSNVRHVGLVQVSTFAEALENQARDEEFEALEKATDQVNRVAEAVADWAEEMLKT